MMEGNGESGSEKFVVVEAAVMNGSDVVVEDGQAIEAGLPIVDGPFDSYGEASESASVGENYFVVGVPASSVSGVSDMGE